MKKVLVSGLLVLMFLMLGCTDSATKKHDGNFYSLTYPSSWLFEHINREGYEFDIFSNQNPYLSLTVQRLEYSEELDEFEEYESLEESVNVEGESIISSRIVTFQGVRSLELVRTIDDVHGTIRNTVVYIPRNEYLAVISYEYYDDGTKAKSAMTTALETLCFN